MHNLKARNAHRLTPVLLEYMLKNGKGASHPSGARIQLDGPACITIEKPNERVIFHKETSTNPFYLTMRAMWAMAGRSDIELLRTYKANINPQEIPVGHAWRGLFGCDQLPGIIEGIRQQPMLQVWFPTGAQLQDVDRNLSACFRQTVTGELDLLLYNGPTMVLDGLLEEDLYTYSVLHEFVATATNMELGKLRVVTSCLWMPTTGMMLDMVDSLSLVTSELCPYEVQSLVPYPILKTASTAPDWTKDLDMLITEGPATMGVKDPFFRRVLSPLVAAWQCFASNDTSAAMALCFEIQDPALAMACREYLEAVRRAKFNKKDEPR